MDQRTTRSDDRHEPTYLRFPWIPTSFAAQAWCLAMSTSMPALLGQSHITTLSELGKHLRNNSKHAAYTRLLADLAVDPSCLGDYLENQKLLYAEQPGCWFSPRDLIRYRLLDALVGSTRFDEEVSGIWALGNDGMTHNGLKRYFIEFDLHEQTRPVRLVGSTFLRRNRHLAYSSLEMKKKDRERIRLIFDTCLHILQAVAESPGSFVARARAMRNESSHRIVSALLPGDFGRASLVGFAEQLASYDLEAACRHLRSLGHEQVGGPSWTAYWNQLNEAFFGTKIRSLDDPFNRMILAVRDPVQMSRQLMTWLQHPACEPITVASILTEVGKYRVVFFDPVHEGFFIRSGSDRSPISWHEIRCLASQGRTGGPTGVLEYLLLAACGFYLLIDANDGSCAFQKKAYEIHQARTGLKYPWFAFDVGGPFRRDHYLELYREDFEGRCRASIEWCLQN